MKPLTTTQAASLMGCSTQLIRRLCSQGRLRAEKPGRDWVIDEQSMIEFAKIPRKAGRPPKIAPGGAKG